MSDRMSAYLSRMHDMDTSLCLRFNRTSRYRLVRVFFSLTSRLGDGIFWVAVMLGILLAERAAGVMPVLHMAVAGGCGTLIYKAIKGKTLRPRPYEVHQAISLAGAPLDRFSFPSGHTLHAVVFSAVALAYYPMLSWLLLPFTLLVALSRVVLGLHYPSDVLAGAAIGLLIAKLSLLIG
jgi:undecaprenyl-diphosphatase